ncbi:MAG: HD domain-containing protein, partial [Erysipelotrichaceae bacterium]|nr:HD domain-containing protein [Erysipelotrichaceae bacterium]
MTNLKKSKTDFKALAKALDEADLSMPDTASPDELRLYQLVALVSKTMLKSSYENLPQAFELSLKIVGTYLDVDRVYIFKLNEDLTRMSNTTEWCHKGVEPAIEMLQDLDVEIFPWWMKNLKSGQIIQVEDVSKMDDNQLAEREILQAQSIKSVLVVPLILDQKLAGFLGFDYVRNKRKWSTEEINSLIFLSDIFSSATRRQENENKLRASRDQLESILNQTVESFGTIIGINDPYTMNHQVRVSQLVVQIGKVLKLDPFMIEGIKLAAMMHDVGVIHFPSQIINKTFSLTPKEYALIKTHPRRGYEIVHRIDFPQPVADIILQHHEKIDGSGYP